MSKTNKVLRVMWQSGQCFGWELRPIPGKTHRCGMDFIPDVKLAPVNDGLALPVEGRDDLRIYADVHGYNELVQMEQEID